MFVNLVMFTVVGVCVDYGDVYVFHISFVSVLFMLLEFVLKYVV